MIRAIRLWLSHYRAGGYLVIEQVQRKLYGQSVKTVAGPSIYAIASVVFQQLPELDTIVVNCSAFLASYAPSHCRTILLFGTRKDSLEKRVLLKKFRPTGAF